MDTSAQPQPTSSTDNDAARVVYQLGLQMLLSGEPRKAARCFQEVSRAYGDWPLLWLRLTECCLVSHWEEQRAHREDGEQGAQQDGGKRRLGERSGVSRSERQGGKRSMPVTVMSGKTEDTWQYLLLPAGAIGSLNQYVAEGESSVLDGTDGVLTGRSTALDGLAGAMERRVGGGAVGESKGKGVASSSTVGESHGSGKGKGGETGKVGGLSAPTPLPDSLPFARMCLKNAIRLLLSNPPHATTATTPNPTSGSSDSSSATGSSRPTPSPYPLLSPACHERVLLSALCQLAWVELALLNSLACLTAAQQALSLLAATATHAQGSSESPSQASFLRLYAAEALCLLGRPAEAMGFLSECLVEFLEASPSAAAAVVGGGGGEGREWGNMGREGWRECVYVNLAALHAMRGDVAEAQACAERAGGRGAAGAGGMALVVQAYLQLRQAVEGDGGEEGAGDGGDQGVKGGRWQKGCNRALELLQRSGMVWFRTCSSHDGMGG